MASQRVRDHFGVLEYLKGLNKSEQKKFIQNSNIDFLKTISEICLNLCKGHIHLSPADLDKLRKYKSQIISLSKKKPSIKQRKVICTQKGGFLGSLISVALPAIVSAIVTATQKK